MIRDLAGGIPKKDGEKWSFGGFRKYLTDRLN